MSGEIAGKVWVDQDLCTGDGLCAEIVPKIFEIADDGLAYVKHAGWISINSKDGSSVSSEPILKMSEGTADIPADLLDETVEAAEYCPGECIFIET